MQCAQGNGHQFNVCILYFPIEYVILCALSLSLRMQSNVILCLMSNSMLIYGRLVIKLQLEIVWSYIEQTTHRDGVSEREWYRISISIYSESMLLLGLSERNWERERKRKTEKLFNLFVIIVLALGYENFCVRCLLSSLNRLRYCTGHVAICLP